MGFSEAEMLDLLPYVDADNASGDAGPAGLLGLDSGEIGEPTTTADASAAFKDIDGDSGDRRLQQLGCFGRADPVGTADRCQ
jgi:hypothetical protein